MVYPFQKEIYFEIPEELNVPEVITEDYKDLGPLHLRICEGITFTSKNELPIVKPSYCSPPDELQALYRIKNKQFQKGKVVYPHFFTSDKNIEPVWTYPFKYLNILKRYGCTLSTDFSILMNMLRDQKFYNDFRNKLLAAFFQRHGIDVIAAPSWAELKYIDRFMEGWPHESTIAINSTGIAHDTRSRHIWLDGYYAMLDILKPNRILRYGSQIEGENLEIATFYNNNNRMSNGSKWFL